MPDRRIFIKNLTISFLGAFGLAIQGFLPLDKAWSAVRRLLPKGTDLKTLINENPARLDARDLGIQPLEKFETMGLSDHAVNMKDWQLICTGQVSKELRLTYDQIQALPSLEKPVLLICPGFFANHGRWQGISLGELAKMAEAKKGINYVTISGPAGPYEKTARFPWADIESGRVFLAYRVNGEPLPVKHGYPLRLVAEGVYGSEWVKYVYKVEFDKIDNA
jgi:DMSO/TMAO reductase YedYZ molybdopterin-dependent catalytic subunit